MSTAARYRPPAFRYPVQRSARAGRLVTALAALMPAPALLFTLGLLVQGRSSEALAPLAVALCSLLCSWWGWRQWRHMPQGHLAWDGYGWFWLDAQLHPWPIRLENCWDGQTLLLLRARAAGSPGQHPMGRGRWLTLDSGHAPAFWGELRRALQNTHRASPTR